MTKEQVEPSATPGISEARFAEMFDAAMGDTVPVEAESDAALEEVPESSQEPLETDPEKSQDSVADNPTSADGSMSIAQATMWCKKGGLPAQILKAKSEDEIIALGQEYSTLVRQDDRDFSMRQNRESSKGATDEAPEESGEDVGASTDGDEGNPEAVVSDEEVAELELALGEDAARLVIASRQESAESKRKLDAMEARYQESEVARQAAAVQVQVSGALDGLGDSFPDLSKSDETRQKVIDRAAQLVNAAPDRYASLRDDERLKVVLKEAATLELGPPAAPRQARRTVKPADSTATGSVDAEVGRGEVGRRAFDALYRKHM